MSVISGRSPIMASHISRAATRPMALHHQPGMKSCSRPGTASVRGSAGPLQSKGTNSSDVPQRPRDSALRGFRMRAVRISGTENYAEEAPELLKRYESISFADAHRLVVQLIPTAPSRVLDIGAGTGRDAAGFAALGHSVVAVEPTEELRRGAVLLHPSPMIEWLHDS